MYICDYYLTHKLFCNLTRRTIELFLRRRSAVSAIITKGNRLHSKDSCVSW